MNKFIITSEKIKIGKYTGKYIAIDYRVPKIFKKLEKYGIKYVDLTARYMLFKNYGAIIYKLNKEKKQYEPIIEKVEDLTIEILRGEEITKTSSNSIRVFHFKTKSFVRKTNLFVKPIRPIINDFIVLSKLTQSRITIYLSKTKIKVKSDIISSKELEKFLNNYSNILGQGKTKRSVNAVEKQINLENIYNFEVIKKKLSIPLERVEEIKRDADLSKIDIEIERFFFIYKLIIKTIYYPNIESSESMFMANEQIEMIGDINSLDFDFIKAMYYIIFHTAS